MPIVRHAEEVCHLRLLLRLVQNVDFILSQYRVLDNRCFKNPMNWFYFVNDSDAWRSESIFEVQQRYQACCPRFDGSHFLEIFSLPLSEWCNFWTPVSHDRQHESNHSNGFPTPVMDSYFGDH